MMTANTSERNYEDFAPISDLISEKECDTLLLYLPGFRKEQLKVQLTTSRILRITGERPIGDNKWKRFLKEFPVPSNIDMKDMTAKYEGGILYIRQPKLITPAATEQHDHVQTAAEPPAPAPEPIDQAKTTAEPPAPQLEQEAPSEEKVEKKDEPKEDAVVPRVQKDEISGEKNKDRKEKHVLDETRKQVLGGGSELFKELRKPENLKRVAVYVTLLLILGYHITKMFRSFTKVDEQSVMEYDHQEF